MGILNLLDRLQASETVPSVLTSGNREGTAKPEENQDGSLGSLGSRKKTAWPENLGAGVARRLWLVTHADGRLVSHSYTPPATEEEVHLLYPGALAIESEPEEDTQEGESPPLTFSDFHTDDRITCRQCRQRSGVRCLAAMRREFAQAAPWHEPDPDQLRCCFMFAPLADDPDQTPGAVRWPGMSWQRRQPS